ncbi:MAG TPA: DinB family protein [Bryobacteraceae bacterium]|nr:DinB family protein [Bryobacteraceae bacterium]
MLTEPERHRVIRLLEDSRTEFLAAVDGLSDAQWSFKPGPAAWSVAECAEHIMLSEDLLFSRVKKAIARSPNPDWAAQTAGKHVLLERALLSRIGKALAPQAIAPTGKFARGEILSRYMGSRAQTLEFMRTTGLPLHQYTVDHPFPAFATLSAYQWALYIPLHNMRHAQQIAEVKTAADYPG